MTYYTPSNAKHESIHKKIACKYKLNYNATNFIYRQDKSKYPIAVIARLRRSKLGPGPYQLKKLII